MKKLLLLMIAMVSVFSMTLQAVDVTLGEKITGLYVSFFNRAADERGLTYWTNRGNSSPNQSSVLKELAAGFASHPSFERAYGDLNNSEFVEAVYRNTLGREGDAQGITFWSRLIDGGMSRSDFVATFVEAALTFDRDDPQYADLSEEDLNAAQLRRDLLANKVEVALQFTAQLGNLTNVTDDQNPENAPAYKASIKIISKVTETEKSKNCALTFLEIYTNDNITDKINTINTMDIKCTLDFYTNISNTYTPLQIEARYTAYQVKVSKDKTKLYVADKKGLSIYDLTQQTPSLMGSYNIMGASKCLTISEDETIAYLGISPSNVHILDISNPSEPSRISTYHTSKTPAGIKLSPDNKILYIAHNRGLEIVNVSTPSSPTLVGSLEMDMRASDLALAKDNTKVYLTDFTEGLKVIDISSPESPVMLSTLNTNGNAQHICISEDGTTAYVANSNKGLCIVDISNPLSLSIIPSSYDFTVSYVTGIALSDNPSVIYLTDYANGIFAVDISNPLTPKQLQHYDTEGLATDITVSSKQLYITTSSPTIEVIDTRVPSASPKLGFYSIYGANVQRLKLSADTPMAYITDGYTGLHIIDVSTPSQPFEKATITYGGYSLGMDISNDNKTLYMAHSSNGLDIIDITDTISPSMLSNYPSMSTAFDVALSTDNTKAYITDKTDGLKIIDISDNTSPTLISSYDMSANIYQIALSADETKAYIANGNAGLKIFDISNPLVPILMGTYDTNGTAYDVSLSSDNTKAFVADGDAGLKIIDISNPAIPSLISTYKTDETVYSVCLSSDDKKIYLANGDGGMIVLDIQIPSQPILIKTYQTAKFAREIVLSKDDSLIYLVDNFGLYILDSNTGTIALSKNFDIETLHLTAYANDGVNIDINVSSNRDDIITIGSFASTFVSNLDRNTIEIPIHSINEQIGQTVLTITLSYGRTVVEKKLYVNVYP